MRQIRSRIALFLCISLLCGCAGCALQVERTPVTEVPERSDRERFADAFSVCAVQIVRAVLPGSDGDTQWFTRLLDTTEARKTDLSVELTAADVFEKSFLEGNPVTLTLSSVRDPGTAVFYGSADATDGAKSTRAEVWESDPGSAVLKFGNENAFCMDVSRSSRLLSELLSDPDAYAYSHATVPYVFCDRFVPDADCDTLTSYSMACHPFRMLRELLFPGAESQIVLRQIRCYTCAGEPLGIDLSFDYGHVPLILRCDAVLSAEDRSTRFRARLYPDGGPDPEHAVSVGSLDLCSVSDPSGEHAEGTVTAELARSFFDLRAAYADLRPGSPDSLSVSLTFTSNLRSGFRGTEWDIRMITGHNVYETVTEGLHASLRTFFSDGFRTVIEFDGPFSELEYLACKLTFSDMPTESGTIFRIPDVPEDPEADRESRASFADRLAALLQTNSFSLWTVLFRGDEPLPKGETYRIYTSGEGSMAAAFFPSPLPDGAFSCSGQYERTASYTCSGTVYRVTEAGSDPYEIVPGKNGVTEASYPGGILLLRKGSKQWFFDKNGTVRISDRVTFRFGNRLDSASRLLTITNSAGQELISEAVLDEEPDGSFTIAGSRFSPLSS